VHVKAKCISTGPNPKSGNWRLEKRPISVLNTMFALEEKKKLNIFKLKLAYK